MQLDLQILCDSSHVHASSRHGDCRPSESSHTYNCVVLLSPLILPVFERQQRKGDSNSVDRRLYADSRPCERPHCLPCILCRW
jgi:hypothetical protein